MADPIFGDFGGLGDMFGSGSMGDFTSTFDSWMGSITSMNNIDFVGIITVGFALVVIATSIYASMKEIQYMKKGGR